MSASRPHPSRDGRLLRRAGLPAVVAVAVAVLAGCAAGTSAGTAPSSPATTGASTPGAAAGRSITVSATGTADGTPDTVTLQIGVETSASSASAALADNNSKAAALIATLKDKGVADKDLQTSQLSVNPNRDQDGRITGYQVQDMVTVTLRKVDTAGAVIDAAAGTAGNAARLYGISFSVSDDSALRADARTAAVKNARAQAEQLAAAGGVAVGDVLSITEGSVDQPMSTYAVAADAGGAASVPLQAGTQQLTVSVQVVFGVR